MIGLLEQAGVLAGAVLLLLTLPGAIELLLVTSGILRRHKVLNATVPPDFRLAILIPAHNEEVLIGRTVASVLDSARELTGCSVVVIADNCTDATVARAREAAARVLVREDLERRGKGHALRFAFDQLQNEGFHGFLIVDADSIVSSNLTREIACHLVSGADAVQARYRVADASDSLRKRLMDVGLLAFNVLRPYGRIGWGWSAGITGNGFAVSRRTLLDVPYVAESIVEDLEYHLLLVSAGKRVTFANRATVYGDIPDDRPALSSQRARWEGGRLRVAREWVPKLIARLGRGQLSVSEPLLDLLTLPLAYQVLAALLLCGLPVPMFRWYGVAVLAVIVMHVCAGVMMGGRPLASFAALATAPFYILWKITTLGAVFRSSQRKAEWVRTQREAGEI
jgi:cellulose synthase/poly-beta-1,6-N-acetylglucosamine synthase-like glycosyltransferase